MTFVSWMLVIIGFALIVVWLIWYIFLPTKRLTYLEKKALIEERQQTLLKLGNAIHTRLEAVRPLITKAGEMDLFKYWEKYLKHNYKYIITRHIPRTKLKIQRELFRHGFLSNNLYYAELKESNQDYKSAIDAYNIAYAQIDDSARKALRGKVSNLWKYEHKCKSGEIFAVLSLSNNLPNIPSGIRIGLRGTQLLSSSFQKFLEAVEIQIYSLREGEDL